MISSAEFSPCRIYRYTLYRDWNGLPYILFVLLNPSTADEVQNDPTIRRCLNFAKSWGYGGAYIGNIFAYRSTNPYLLYTHQDPVGPENDQNLLRMASLCDKVVCGWGVHGGHLDRDRQVVKLLTTYQLECLGMTQKGYPKHPLYLKHTTSLISYSGRPYE